MRSLAGPLPSARRPWGKKRGQGEATLDLKIAGKGFVAGNIGHLPHFNQAVWWLWGGVRRLCMPLLGRKELEEDGVALISTDPSAPEPAGLHTTGRLWSPELLRRWAGNGALMLLWFGLSNAIILGIKVLVSSAPSPPTQDAPPGQTPPPARQAVFPYPLTITAAVQMLVGLMATAASRIRYCGVAAPSREQMLRFAVPIGVCTALEIGGTNYALRILHFSFAQILKCAGPIFMLIVALLFKLETFQCQYLVCLLCMSGGLAVASMGEDGIGFEVFGMLVQLGACAVGAIKWALVQILLQREGGFLQGGRDGDREAVAGQNADWDAESAEGHTHRLKKMSPLSTIMCTSPVSALVLVMLAVAMEGKMVLSTVQGWLVVPGEGSAMLTVGVSCVGVSCLVFVVLLLEYALVRDTSSLAVAVAGIFKELTGVGLGLFLLSNKVTLLNIVGFFTSQVGILTYTGMKYRENLEREPPAVLQPVVCLPGLQSPVSAGTEEGALVEDGHGLQDIDPERSPR